MKTEILIIGGDGDLSVRKLYPALFSLEQAGELENVTRITGLARNPKDQDTLINMIHERLTEKGRFDESDWDKFASRISLLAGDATDPADFAAYRESLDLDQVQLTVYFAIPPSIFEGVCVALDAAGLVTAHTRVVVEKPLGVDRESFIEIHDSLSKIFDESQVYRIDHYLGKEAVQNLLALRFANVIFGSVWNGNFVDNVQITLAEDIGVEDRHDFYEETGALRDMVQNHMLQLLCLIAMEPPADKRPEMIRGEKLKVLQSLKPIELEDINSCTVRGQYSSGSVNGELVESYLKEVADTEASNTETYVAIKAEIVNWRWASVPFYLRTGKRLASRCAEVIIQFRKPKHNIFPGQMLDLAGNQLRIRLQPDEGIELHILNKQPGLGELPMQPVSLNLAMPDSTKQVSFDAYARLFMEVLRGDQTLFVSADEVIASWNWIDKIRENWDLMQSKAHSYSAGTMGPPQAIAMVAKDDREWVDLSR